MKILVRALTLLAILSAVTWMGIATHAAPVISDVPDEIASNIRGGGCGHTWNTVTLLCRGKKKCDHKILDCSSQSTNQLVKNGPGNDVQDGSGANFSCNICSTPTKICGDPRHYVDGVKGCSRSK